MKNKLFGIFVILFILIVSTTANAAYIYVGSWEVDDGPWWTTNPNAYSGQEAAALLFGGNASDYVISTRDSNPLNINNLAWYSVLGLSGGHMFAENYFSTLSSQDPGFYYSGQTYRSQDLTEAASAYVGDNAQGSNYTNYAFRQDVVPEPATMVLFGLGLLGLVGVSRKK